MNELANMNYIEVAPSKLPCDIYSLFSKGKPTNDEAP